MGLVTWTNASAPYRYTDDPRALAFRRVRRVFGWTTAAAVAAVGVIVGVVAHEIPGRASPPPASASGIASGATSGSPGTTAGGSPGTTAGASPGAASQSASGAGSSLTPPSSVPAPTTRSPAVVSGGTGW